jgi:hypothetical protein
VGSAVAIAVYALVAAVVLRRAGVVSGGIPADLARTATWVAAGYFLLGVGLNLASRSRPERLLMSPTAAVLCVLCAVVAAG